MPAARLSPTDIVIVAAYIAAMTVMGAWFTRRQKDLKAYFVGGRNVGWFMVLVSIVATETSAVTFLSVPGLAFKPDGFDVCRTLKGDALTRNVPVVMLSAHDEAADVAEGRAVGASDYLLKPFGPIELINAIRKVLDLK